MPRKLAIDQFKCSRCVGYLSAFPLYSLKDGSIICNRCYEGDQTIDGIDYRNKPLENYLKSTQFPCINKDRGCEEQFLPAQIPRHERNCKFELRECTFSEACGWSGGLKYLQDHYEDAHKDFVIKDGQIDLDLTPGFEGHYMFTDENVTTIVGMRFRNSILECKFFIVSGEVEGFKCMLLLNTSENRQPMVVATACSTRISEDFMMTAIEVANFSEYKNVLLCSYCQEPATWNQAICNKGHTVCINCIFVHQENCNHDLENKSNMEIFSKKRFECKFNRSGCRFMQKNASLTFAHEVDCPYNKCVLCSAKPFGIKHYEDDHTEEFRVNNSYMGTFRFDNHFYITFYQYILFRVELSQFELNISKKNNNWTFNVKLFTNALVLKRFSIRFKFYFTNSKKSVIFHYKQTKNYTKFLRYVMHVEQEYSVTYPKKQVVEFEFEVFEFNPINF